MIVFAYNMHNRRWAFCFETGPDTEMRFCWVINNELILNFNNTVTKAF